VRFDVGVSSEALRLTLTGPLALVVAGCVALTGCGGGSDSDTSTASVGQASANTTVAAPSGPAVRICDRRFARRLAVVLRSGGFQGTTSVHTHPSGSPRHSSCELGPVELTVDNAPDAYQRYLNRIVETAQFSESLPSRVPRTVKGVGDPDLGAAGANWIPFLRQLISARGKRVLIAEVHGGGLSDAERLALTRRVSLLAWGRLGSR
jgi:hypothetical protein